MILNSVRIGLNIVGILLILLGLYWDTQVSRILRDRLRGQYATKSSPNMYAMRRRAARLHWTGMALIGAQLLLHWILE